MQHKILDAEWLDLGPTKSYPRRWAFFVPTDIYGPDQRGRATAKIQQQHGHRSGNRIEEDVYRIEDHGPVPGAMARQYLFLNVSDPSQEQPYLVTVGPHISECTCKAGKCKVEVCKHRSLAALIVDLDLIPDHDEPGSDTERNGKWIEEEIPA